jgi:hypothetical protein
MFDNLLERALPQGMPERRQQFTLHNPMCAKESRRALLFLFFHASLNSQL